MYKEGLYDGDSKNSLFLKIYSEQSNSSRSSFSVVIKNVIYNMIKYRYKNNKSINRFEDFLSKLKSSEIQSIMDYYNIKKSIMIEWALTVEFLKYFLPVMLKENKLTLYRTIHRDQYEKGDYINKRDLFESTSLFGPSFRTNSSDMYFATFSNVPTYKCIFNYVITPIQFGFFTGLDFEQEFGCIIKGIMYEKLYYNDYNNDGNIKVNTYYKHYVSRCMFLRDQFINTLKNNFKKVKYKDKEDIINDKKIILPKLFGPLIAIMCNIYKTKIDAEIMIPL